MHIITDVIAKIWLRWRDGVWQGTVNGIFHKLSNADHFQPYQEAVFAFSNTTVSKHNLETVTPGTSLAAGKR